MLIFGAIFFKSQNKVYLLAMFSNGDLWVNFPTMIFFFLCIEICKATAVQILEFYFLCVGTSKTILELNSCERIPVSTATEKAVGKV